MTTLFLGGICLAVVLLINGTHRFTRNRRPQWSICDMCNRRAIFIHGVGRWLHVIGDVDSAYEAIENHSVLPRRGSIHVRRK